ncbi:MAG: glycosyltransferase [Candidatus Dormibacteria bacterium]
MSAVAPRLSYVLAVHNSASFLAGTVQRVVTRLDGMPGSEVILVENGSRDESALLCDELSLRATTANVTVVSARSATGLGWALRRGMELAKGELIVLSAADLPFGFTDLDGWLSRTPRAALGLGSKGHPDSSILAPSLIRHSVSWVFRVLRRALVGLNVADSQGSILIQSRLARRVLPHLACTDYLVSTEIICWAVQLGAAPVELPIRYPPPASSTVSPLSDAWRMAVGLVALRRRLRAVPARLLKSDAPIGGGPRHS